VTFLSHRSGVIHSTGITGGIWDFSTQAYFAAIILANVKLAIEVQNWTVLHHLAIWLSIIIW
jgi:hypothetical protein